MEITIIIGLVLFIVCVFLAIKLIKNVFASIGTVILLVIVFIGGCGFFVYNDAMTLYNNFPNSVNQILYVNDQGVANGIAIMPTKNSEFSLQAIQPLDNEKIKQLNENYVNGNYKNMLSVVKTSDYYPSEIISQNEYNEDSYKIILINSDVIENAPISEIDIAEKLSVFDENLGMISLSLTKEELLNILASEDPWEMLKGKLSDSIDVNDILNLSESFGVDLGDVSEDMLPTELTDEQEDLIFTEITLELKSMMVSNIGTDDITPFILMLSLQEIAVQEEGLNYLFSTYKSKEITVYPNSVIFDLIRMSPNALIDKVKQEANLALAEAQGN